MGFGTREGLVTGEHGGGAVGGEERPVYCRRMEWSIRLGAMQGCLRMEQ